MFRNNEKMVFVEGGNKVISCWRKNFVKMSIVVVYGVGWFKNKWGLNGI